MNADHIPVIGDQGTFRSAMMTAAGGSPDNERLARAFNQTMRAEIEIAALTMPEISGGSKALSAEGNRIVAAQGFGQGTGGIEL